MPLIDYKSTLSNYRRVIKPKPSENMATKAVPFGEYTPVTNHLNEYEDDRYSFSTKKLESFDRKKINEQFETDSVLEKNSVYDDVNTQKKDLTKSNVVNNTQTPYTEIKTEGNNEESPIQIAPQNKIPDKELQARTIDPVSQEDRTSNLISKYELRNKIKVDEPKQLEKINSKYNIDEKPRGPQIGGRYEVEKESRFGFLSTNKPSVNAFSDKFNNGFKIKNPAGFTQAAFDYSWGGTKQSAPETNYFSNQYVRSGFTKFVKIGDTKFKEDALPKIGQVDYFSNRYSKNFQINQKETRFTDEALKYTNLNAVDYFGNQYSNNFIINTKPLETGYTNDGLNFGLRQLSTVDFFDLNKNYTIAGFVKNQKMYITDFNSNALDWGLKGINPVTNYFDVSSEYTTTGFTLKQKLYETDFNLYALDYGLKGIYPLTNYFDQTKQFTTTGFTFKQQIYITDFNASALDWGLKGTNPVTNYFDQTKQFTDTGFTFKQQLLSTDFNASALDWGLKGTNPTTDYFDQNKQFTNTGFTFKQQLLITDFNSDALDWGLKGTNPTTDYFDQNKQFTDNGFTFKQQLLTTDFNASALDWGLKGTNPTTDYFDQNKQFTQNGFVFKNALLTTDFNSDALDWGLKGTNPTTNYFDQRNEFTVNGFTFRQPILSTDFNASALDWGLRGTNPTTDYFDQRKEYTNTGFTFKQPVYVTDFNTSALDWGLKGTNPSTNYFDQTNNFTIAGFVIRQGIYNTDFNTSALDYSLQNIPPLSSGVSSVDVTTISGKQYAQTDYFDKQKINTTRGFHVLARPLEPTSYKTDSTQFFTVPASDFEIPRIGSPVHNINSQLVKSPIFLNVGFVKENRNTYSELIRGRNFVSFLGDVATKQNSPSLLDIQYEKYSLQEESINYDISLLGRQPYITRGIQNKGQIENERWGFGVNFDDGLIRGGIVTALDRSANDVLRLTKWTASTKGLLYIVKQAGLQLSNPNTEAGNLGATKIYQPLSPLLSAGLNAFGQHIPRHGLIPIVTKDKYEDVIKVKRALFETDPNLSNRNIQISSEFSLLTADQRVVIPITSKPTGDIINSISALTGPNSVYGIGVTNFYRNSVSIPYDAYVKYSPEINPLFTPGRYLDYQNGLINTYDVSDIRINRNVELASELGFFQDWYELPFDRNPNSSIFYFGQGIKRISGEPPDSTKIHRFSVSIPDNSLQKYSTKYQYASPFSISNVKSRDLLFSQRELADSSATTSMLKNIYLAFQGDNNISLLFKDGKTTSDKHILNFGIDGNNDSVQYIKGLSSRILAIYPSSLDVYSPHTVRNPIPYSYGGDEDALTFGAWSKDRNINRPFLSSLEQYGIVSKRLKGFYAPERMTLGKNVTDTRTSLRLYDVGYDESPTVSTAARAKIGPLSEKAIEAKEEGKFKLSRMYDIMVDYAKRYRTPNDILNAEFQNFSSYDDDDNIDIKFYIKNLLNPLNKVIEDLDYISSDNRFININKRVNIGTATTPEYIYKPNSLKEYSVMSYTDIPDIYTDPNRGSVSIGPAPSDSTGNDFQGQGVDRTRELNNRRFYDFRYKVHSFTQKEEGNVFPKAEGRVSFVTSPEIIKYRSNNLEDATGFGKHGLPGADRTNPVLSFLCGRVSQGVRQINGEQYGGYHTFRGDRVNLVDFRHDKSTTDIREIYEMGENSLIPGKKDLIEFYVTGTGERDRVIVFRASINEVSDNFNPSWETVKYLNRADPAYIYRGFERDVTISFDIGITSRDELRTRWRSLNALAGFTAPEYINSINPDLDGRMKAPLMKLTLGHLYRSTPCIVTSLNYSFDNSQVVWETAKLTRWVNGQEIEETITTNDLDDPACCVALQLPKMIKVTMNLKILGNYRPQSNGGASGYPDMGVFYQLYASDDGASDGQLPRKGGIYVNYFNRECTIVNLPPEQPKIREEVQIMKEEKPTFKEEPQVTKEEVKRNVVPTKPDDQPSKGEKDNQLDDDKPIERVQEETDTGKGEGISKRQGPSSKKKPRRENSNGAKSSRDIQPNPSSVNSPKTPAGQAVPYP